MTKKRPTKNKTNTDILLKYKLEGNWSLNNIVKATKKRFSKKDNNCSIKKRPISLENITHIVYLCQTLSFLFGITAVLGAIINYLKYNEAKNTYFEAHFLWQVKTFWLGLLFGIVGVIFIPILIGFLILAADIVWIIYRVIKGWLSLCENDSIENVNISSRNF